MAGHASGRRGQSDLSIQQCGDLAYGGTGARREHFVSLSLGALLGANVGTTSTAWLGGRMVTTNCQSGDGVRCARVAPYLP
jgi:hypothetical protein